MQMPLRILLLEDNPLDAELIEETLHEDGVECEIRCVDTREEFLAALDSDRFRLVCADYSLPGFNGMAALALTRERHPDLPFILVSGRMGEEFAIEALKGGATDYVLKNNLTRLASSVRRVLRESEEQTRRRNAEEALRIAYDDLERRVRERTGELLTANEVLRIEIVERMRTEAALRESKELNQAVLSSLQSHIAVLDREGRIIAVNDAWTGFARGQGGAQYLHRTGVGANYLEVCREASGRDDHEAHLALDGIQSVLDGKIPHFLMEYPCHSPTERRWFLMSVTPLLCESGGAVISHANITSRRAAEEKLAEQAALLNQTLEAIISCDLEGRILFWNRGAEHIYGWLAEEVQGRNIDKELYRGNFAASDKARAELLKTGKWTGEVRQFMKSGAEIIFEGHWTLIRDQGGKPKSILIVNYDISERRALEAQFFRAQRMESIGRLASGIAHDLNNVLSPVLMGTQMLQLKLQGAEDQRLLEVMRGNIERGAQMIKQILLFARGVQGERIPLQTKHLISEIVKVVGETFPKSIQVKVAIPNEPRLILGDTTQIHQVLMNLCVNARDAMPKGGILTIRTENVRVDDVYARMYPDARPGDYLLISISDTGEGIPPNIISKIFDPFFTTKEQGRGTGLGLSTVQGIVKNHGGFVNVYSEPGNGAEFKVYFPIAESSYDVTEAEEIDWPAGNGELLLLVDDESAIREMAKNTLETFGYRTLTAADGAEAVALFVQRKDEIRLVITDLMMPVMDGPATIRALRKLAPSLPIIASSGLAGSERTLEASQAGVNSFLSKPYTADRLLKAVADAFRETGD